MRASAVDVIKLEPIRPINLAPPATRAVGFAAREKVQSSESTISAIAATVRAHRVRMRLTPPFRSFRLCPGHGDAPGDELPITSRRGRTREYPGHQHLRCPVPGRLRRPGLRGRARR